MLLLYLKEAACYLFLILTFALFKLLQHRDTAQLIVNVLGDYTVTYTSHVDYICLTLSNCPHWQLATSIAWKDLPKDNFAIFYETETCRTGGKYFYISDVAEVDGTHTLQTPTAIRSFMVGTNNAYMRRPSRIVSTCVEESTSLEDATRALNGTASNSTYEIKWKTDDAAAAGGLSSNWSDVLP
ncbi:hypothetical protein JG688_00010676 [Phytophthora aleatoria]|uniref:Uncharacterized protein n=1 Tax=Phytophthora aleatoria TaxID=2496075 RepID=A0A8J5ILL4_9STRA|nr:hypothetical protein JG688_00010676 [Phytophthora aleatoria]